MIEISTFEAKTHLSHLLNQVQQGECVKITKHNIPIAYLIPTENCIHSLENVYEAFKKFQVGKKLKGLSLRSLINEGRK